MLLLRCGGTAAKSRAAKSSRVRGSGRAADVRRSALPAPLSCATAAAPARSTISGSDRPSAAEAASPRHADAPAGEHTSAPDSEAPRRHGAAACRPAPWPRRCLVLGLRCRGAREEREASGGRAAQRPAAALARSSSPLDTRLLRRRNPVFPAAALQRQQCHFTAPDGSPAPATLQPLRLRAPDGEVSALPESRARGFWPSRSSFHLAGLSEAIRRIRAASATASQSAESAWLRDWRAVVSCEVAGEACKQAEGFALCRLGRASRVPADIPFRKASQQRASKPSCSRHCALDPDLLPLHMRLNLLISPSLLLRAVRRSRSGGGLLADSPLRRLLCRAAWRPAPEARA
jgi:hypothetical protein